MRGRHLGAIMAKSLIKLDDRVKRVRGEGCYGTVREVRAEVSLSSESTREVGYIVVVSWDNGTVSSFSPDGLVVIKG
jgi:hypothetical protein